MVQGVITDLNTLAARFGRISLCPGLPVATQGVAWVTVAGEYEEMQELNRLHAQVDGAALGRGFHEASTSFLGQIVLGRFDENATEMLHQALMDVYIHDPETLEPIEIRRGLPGPTGEREGLSRVKHSCRLASTSFAGFTSCP